MSLAFHVPLPAAQRSAAISRAAAMPVATAVCACVAATAVAATEPGDFGALTACPIRAATGVWCPGCGLTRAAHHLFRGNVGQALSFNLFVVVFLAGIAAAWFVWLRVATGHGVPAVVMRIRIRTYLVVGLVLIAFTAVRNVSGLDVLRGG